MTANAREFVERTISSPHSTEEDFHRLAELLVELSEPKLLEMVVDAAGRSDDPDIRDVAHDYG
jgi:hypothetical protein